MEVYMESIWHDTELPEFPQLQGELHTDVLIIGGGMAGLLTAYFLQKSGVKYVLVEKERIGFGVTGNTTAKITTQHGLIYHKLLKDGGEEVARKYLKANRLAAGTYARMCKEIRCDYETRDNYVYSVDHPGKLEQEIEALRRLGCGAELCERLPLPIETVGAVKMPGQAQFHPLRFLAGIVGNLKIYEHTFVREMIENTAVTDQGKIYAEQVVVATHFPFLNKHGSYFLKLYQHRSYELALEGAQELPGMYVDENHRGMSFRNYGDLLLLGGGGHRTGKKGGNWQELRDFARAYYPKAKEQAFWAAQDCMSLDGIPYIGPYSKNTEKLYVVTGFNKWGMTGAMVGALLLRDMLTGIPNDWGDIFDPSRNMMKPQLFFNGAEAVMNLMSISKKRCPHLGCALKWNKAEQSWDCPCHGSRFSQDGKVLDNPANGDLPE